MNMWTAIVLIVLAVMATEAWRHHIKSRDSKSNQEELDRLNQRIGDLEKELRDRVETLERIVTDSKDDLKRKFDHLDKVG